MSSMLIHVVRDICNQSLLLDDALEDGSAFWISVSILYFFSYFTRYTRAVCALEIVQLTHSSCKRYLYRLSTAVCAAPLASQAQAKCRILSVFKNKNKKPPTGNIVSFGL